MTTQSEQSEPQSAAPTLYPALATETRLVKYDAARQALAEAHRVDAVKDIRDRHVAVAAYARQANDKDLLRWASDIKLRAERKVGALLEKMEKIPGARAKGVGRRGTATTPSLDNDSVVVAVPTTPTLADLGITLDQSSDWQALAKIPEAEFERRLEETAQQGKIPTTTSMTVDAAAKIRPKKTPARVEVAVEAGTLTLAEGYEAIKAATTIAEVWEAFDAIRIRLMNLTPSQRTTYAAAALLRQDDLVERADRVEQAKAVPSKRDDDDDGRATSPAIVETILFPEAIERGIDTLHAVSEVLEALVLKEGDVVGHHPSADEWFTTLMTVRKRLNRVILHVGMFRTRRRRRRRATS